MVGRKPDANFAAMEQAKYDVNLCAPEEMVLNISKYNVRNLQVN